MDKQNSKQIRLGIQRQFQKDTAKFVEAIITLVKGAEKLPRKSQNKLLKFIEKTWVEENQEAANILSNFDKKVNPPSSGTLPDLSGNPDDLPF